MVAGQCAVSLTLGDYMELGFPGSITSWHRGAAGVSAGSPVGTMPLDALHNCSNFFKRFV